MCVRIWKSSWSEKFFSLFYALMILSLVAPATTLQAQESVNEPISIERFQALRRSMESLLFSDAGGCYFKDSPFISSPPGDLYAYSAWGALYLHDVTSRWSWNRSFERTKYSSFTDIDWVPGSGLLYTPSCYLSDGDAVCETFRQWWDGATTRRWESTDNDGTMYGGSFRTKWTHGVENVRYECSRASCDYSSDGTSENWHSGEVNDYESGDSYPPRHNEYSPTEYRCPIQTGVAAPGIESERQNVRCSGANVSLIRGYSSEKEWKHDMRDGSQSTFTRRQALRERLMYKRQTSLREFPGLYTDTVSITRAKVIPVKLPKLVRYAERAELELDMSVYVAHSVPECEGAFAPELELELSIITGDWEWLSLGRVAMSKAQQDKEHPLPLQLCDDNGRCFQRYDVTTAVELDPKDEKDLRIIVELLESKRLTFSLYDESLELPADPHIAEQTWPVQCREIPTAVNIGFSYGFEGHPLATVEARRFAEGWYMPRNMRIMSTIEEQAGMEGPYTLSDSEYRERNGDKNSALESLRDQIGDARTLFLYITGHGSLYRQEDGSSGWMLSLPFIPEECLNELHQNILSTSATGCELSADGKECDVCLAEEYKDPRTFSNPICQNFFLFPEDIANLLKDKRAIVSVDACFSSYLAKRRDLWEDMELYLLTSGTGPTDLSVFRGIERSLAVRMFGNHLIESSTSQNPYEIDSILNDIDQRTELGEITLQELVEHMQGYHMADSDLHIGFSMVKNLFDTRQCTSLNASTPHSEPGFCVTCSDLGNVVLKEKKGKFWGSSANPQPSASQSPVPSASPFY